MSKTFWVRTAHLKAMAMHAREQLFVLDVDQDGVARMQAYAHRELNLNEEEAVQTGTVTTIPTSAASTLLQE